MVSKVMEHFEILGVTYIDYDGRTGDIYGNYNCERIKLYTYYDSRCLHMIRDIDTKKWLMFHSFDEITGYLEVSKLGGMIW